MTQDTVEVFCFEINGAIFGVDSSDVVRIGTRHESEGISCALGKPATRNRTVVFRTSEKSEAHLAVDAVLGVRQANKTDLRRLPDTIEKAPGVVGAWLADSQMIMIVDLQALTFH